MLLYFSQGQSVKIWLLFCYLPSLPSNSISFLSVTSLLFREVWWRWYEVRTLEWWNRGQRQLFFPLTLGEGGGNMKTEKKNPRALWWVFKFYLFKKIFIAVELTYNVVLISAMQQMTQLYMYIHTLTILFKYSFPLWFFIGYWHSSLGYTVGPCCLCILCVIAYISNHNLPPVPQSSPLWSYQSVLCICDCLFHR